MDVYSRRKANLRNLIDARFGGNQAALAETVGCKPPQVSRWLSDTATDGRNITEKSARSIEDKLRLTDGWLDQDHEAGGDDADLHHLSRHYQTADATKKAALHDLAELPNEAAADLTPLLEALKLKYKPPS